MSCRWPSPRTSELSCRHARRWAGPGASLRHHPMMPAVPRVPLDRSPLRLLRLATCTASLPLSQCRRRRDQRRMSQLRTARQLHIDRLRRGQLRTKWIRRCHRMVKLRTVWPQRQWTQVPRALARIGTIIGRRISKCKIHSPIATILMQVRQVLQGTHQRIGQRLHLGRGTARIHRRNALHELQDDVHVSSNGFLFSFLPPFFLPYSFLLAVCLPVMIDVLLRFV